ncbi:MAG: hypothetical protein M1833_004771 [Piccolia ochrophora]|nr:MAG: hypothetical protein M1833_004771 [Piccolia ochrophora]
MHKISNITGSARHGWEKMTPAAFGMSRPNPDLPASPSTKRPQASSPMSPSLSSDAIFNLSFNVPFSSNLAGPDGDDVIHASPGALERWIHPEGTPEGTPTHKLPVHANNLETLRRLCREISESSAGAGKIEAAVTSSEPKPIPALQRRPLKGLVTNVCLSGNAEMVHKLRGKILNETPIALKCATVDIDNNLIIDAAADAVKSTVLEHLDIIADYTGTDLFLLGPKAVDPEIAGTSFNGSPDTGLDQRLRVAIYGDMESSEHAKTRVLIMVDQIVRGPIPDNGIENLAHKDLS